jgi:tRNA C32,U32 (ribose-2'-O)-methylase TrmJ
MLLAATGLATASGEADAAPAPSVAVLFGPEDFGLSNAALDYCHAIVTIPTVPNDASLNLAQAAAIVAYELHLAAIGVEVGYPADATSSRLRGEAIVDGFATGAELDALFDSCYHMLTALYQPNIEGRTRAALARIRAMIMRAEPRGDEARLLTTVFEHLARKLQGTSAR